MNQILAITGKELRASFGTPMAAIFIGFFLLCSLFSFFWLETFFARNIADIRPLFRWMPLLMIFLAAALTMRQWSEEQKMGTLEVLLTLPVRIHQLVVGKFLAVLLLTACALFLTLGLPLTVALMGNLDWGPVIGGYLGALLMAGAYISIGLFVSSRTDSQIVSLMVTVLLAGLFYAIGSTGITDFFGNRAADLLRAIGTGSRFTSIERGIIDLRDIIYYLSLTLFFLTLNIFFLDRTRWSFGPSTAAYRKKATIAVVLIGANLLAANIWLSQVNNLRLDLTSQKIHSLSPATRDIIAHLPEPLVLRGYFSARTHPLLSPLVPRIKDLMSEYQTVSRGAVQVSFMDPKFDEEVETEANQLYGIKPVPFQVAGRYEAAVVNSYFHILIKYGDQHVVLGFDDLIEIKQRADGGLDVALRNLEYDLTRSIKKVVYGFQSLASILAAKPDSFRLALLISPQTIPEPFRPLPNTISAVMTKLTKETGNRLVFEEINLDSRSEEEKNALARQYGIEPLKVSFFSEESFFLHLVLVAGDTAERVYLTPDMGEAEVRQEIEGAVKRNGTGFAKTIGIWTQVHADDPMTMPHGPPDNYQILQQLLRENYNLKKIDLADGRVPGDIDILLLVAPQEMTDLDRLAIDQFMMQGGAVVALAGSYLLDLSPASQRLQVREVTDGLAELLAFQGITVEKSLVMDMQNEPFPIPVTRDLGGLLIQEIQRIDYPFFVDVRPENMATDSPITANLPAVTMNWVSPLRLDETKTAGRQVTVLLRSSPQSWLQEGSAIEPDFARYPGNGFAPASDFAPENLAVAMTGSFPSFFADRPDPRQEKKEARSGESVPEESTEAPLQETTNKLDEQDAPSLPLLRKSPGTARLVVIGSAEFVNDTVLSMSQSMGMDRFLNSIEFVQNVIDWSVADEDLLTIRSRGAHARLLKPMGREEQAFWEWLNYGISMLALAGLGIYGAGLRKREKPMQLVDEQ